MSVKKKAELIPTFLFLFLKTNEMLKPIKKQKDAIEIKINQSVPWFIKSTTNGIRRYSEKKIKRFPTTKSEDLKLFISNLIYF